MLFGAASPPSPWLLPQQAGRCSVPQGRPGVRAVCPCVCAGTGTGCYLTVTVSKHANTANKNLQANMSGSWKTKGKSDSF